MRVGESRGHSRVGWAGAIEAPSRGRCGMVPSVTVAVEIVAARRAAREQKPPIKWTLPCGFRHSGNQHEISQSDFSKIPVLKIREKFYESEEPALILPVA